MWAKHPACCVGSNVRSAASKPIVNHRRLRRRSTVVILHHQGTLYEYVVMELAFLEHEYIRNSSGILLQHGFIGLCWRSGVYNNAYSYV